MNQIITKARKQTKVNLDANYGETSGMQELEGNPYSARPDTE